MNQEEDEDAFLYGDASQSGTAGPSSAQHTAATVTDVGDAEPTSEEGEIDNDDEEESDSVSLRYTLQRANPRTSNLSLKQNQESELHHHRIFLYSMSLLILERPRPLPSVGNNDLLLLRRKLRPRQIKSKRVQCFEFHV